MLLADIYANTAQHAAHARSINLVKLPDGSDAIRFAVERDVNMRGLYGGAPRAELYLNDSKPWGTTREYWFSVLVPENWVISEYPVTEVFCLHTRTQQGTVYQSPLDMMIVGNRFQIVQNWNKTPADIGDNVLHDGIFIPGVPVDFYIRTKLSPSSDGFLHIERNGQVIADITGQNCFDNCAGETPYALLGVYQWRWCWPEKSPPICDSRTLFVTSYAAAYH